MEINRIKINIDKTNAISNYIINLKIQQCYYIYYLVYKINIAIYIALFIDICKIQII